MAKEIGAGLLRRPALTAAVRDVVAIAGRDEGTAAGSALHDRVDEDQQLPGAGDKRNLVALSGCAEALVEGLQLWVPKEGCRQGSCIQGFTQALPAALDVTLPMPFGAVIIIGSKTDEGGGLFEGVARGLQAGAHFGEVGEGRNLGTGAVRGEDPMDERAPDGAEAAPR